MEHRKTIRGEDKLIDERFDKLDALRKTGQNPFPPRFNVSKYAEDLQDTYGHLKNDERSGKVESTAGRIVLMRRMGKITFADIKHDGKTVQLFLGEEETEGYEDLEHFDLGDYIGVTGEMMKTRTGEVTLAVEEFQMLSKAVRPLPDKYHGVQNTEIRYRKRYLDTMMNEESFRTFQRRSEILTNIRAFLNSRGFLEVETPVLQPVYGGGAAKPFTTYHNDLKQDLYLRISPELYLKRLIIGGYPKVYDINKNFRNESIDTTHNPEYTMLELYQAYADYNDMMEITEELFKEVCLAIHGTTNVTYGDHTVSFDTPWKRVTMLESIEQHTDLDAKDMSMEELKAFCEENGHALDGEETWGTYVQLIFEEECEHHIIQPTFIIDHPIETTPFCKQTEYDERLVERFEPFCVGMEIANAYTELNDPEKQRELLLRQARLREQGDEEAQPLDEDFLNAVEYGMPPTGGLGIGIDRMVMLMLDKQSIKDVILFPAMKEQHE